MSDIKAECIDSLRGMVRRSFRKLAFEHHPDRGGSEEFMKELVGARDELLVAVEADMEEHFKTEGQG